MTGTAKRRVFLPEDETTRTQREQAYEEARRDLIRRQAERSAREYRKRRRRFFLTFVVFVAAVALAVYAVFG